MKRRTIVALIVAAALIITGGILMVLGLSFAGDSKQESKMQQTDLAIGEPFDSIQLNTADCDVVFALANITADPYVTFREMKNVQHSVQVEDGTLKIQMIDNRKWMDHISISGMSWENAQMIVYLPQEKCASLQITTHTGDIRLTEAILAGEISLRSDTGDIWCNGTSADMLDCMTDTGDIKLSNAECEQIRLKTDTGDKELENVICKMLISESDTGDTDMERVMAEENLQITTNTGDVEIESSDAGAVSIVTDNGDVSGHFLTSKWFQAYSDTGNVRVPHTRDGGECRIESNTGDIHFE